MSGIAIAALTIPGSVAASATTRPGTRMPRPMSRGIRQRYGPTRSSCILRLSRSAGNRRGGTAVRPRHPDERDEHTHDARELGNAERAEPEAVEAERLDREAADRVETDVGKEQGARTPAEPRA